MCSCNQVNRTPKATFEFLAAKKLDPLSAQGVGLFLVPAPELGILSERVVSVDGLTLVETAKRGIGCVAYMFLPHGLELDGAKGKYVVTNARDLEENKWPCHVLSCSSFPEHHSCMPPCFCGSFNACT